MEYSTLLKRSDSPAARQGGRWRRFDACLDRLDRGITGVSGRSLCRRRTSHLPVARSVHGPSADGASKSRMKHVVDGSCSLD